MSANNSMGSSSETNVIEIITLKGMPCNPMNIIAVINGPDSVTLEWAPKYDSGHPQEFVIQYKVFPDGPWVKLDQIKDTGSTKQSITIKDLRQKTTYEFHLHAENTIGTSDNISIIVMTTEMKNCAFPVGAVAGSISGTFVAGSCVGVVIIFLWQRWLKRKRKGDTYESVDIVERNPNRENVYDSLNQDKTEPSSNNAYENTGTVAAHGPIKSGNSHKDQNMEMTGRNS